MNYQTVIAALCAWREARGEGPEGVRAVLWVLYNRSQKWSKSLSQVVIQPKQFSSMTVRGDTQTILWPLDSDITFTQTLTAMQAIVDKTDVDDPTHGALYYANLAGGVDSWFTQNIVGSPKWHPHTATIGKHDFYE